MERVPEPESMLDAEFACRYDEFMRGHRFRQREYRQLARRIMAMDLPRGGRVLDVGTGPGFLALAVARHVKGTGCQVVGLDLSKPMLELATHNACRRWLEDPLAWLQADAKVLPFGEGTFDCVVSSDSLHHWQNPSLVLDEISRVLRKDGKLLIHDLKRPQQWVSRLVSWLMGMTVPSDVRVHYKNSVRAAYTAGELQGILERSPLQGCRIGEELVDITIEWGRDL